MLFHHVQIIFLDYKDFDGNMESYYDGCDHTLDIYQFYSTYFYMVSGKKYT